MKDPEKETLKNQQAAFYNDLSFNGKRITNILVKDLFDIEDQQLTDAATAFVESTINSRIHKNTDDPELYPFNHENPHQNEIVQNLIDMRVDERVEQKYDGSFFFYDLRGRMIPITENFATNLINLSEYDLLVLLNIAKSVNTNLNTSDRPGEVFIFLTELDLVETSIEEYMPYADCRDIILSMTPNLRTILFNNPGVYKDYEPEGPVDTNREKMGEFRQGGFKHNPIASRESLKTYRALTAPLGRSVERMICEQLSGDVSREILELGEVLKKYAQAVLIESMRTDGTFHLKKEHFESMNGINSDLLIHTADILIDFFVIELTQAVFYNNHFVPFSGSPNLDLGLVEELYSDYYPRGAKIKEAGKNTRLIKAALGQKNSYAIFTVLSDYLPLGGPAEIESIEELRVVVSHLRERLLDPTDPAHENLKRIMYGFLGFARIIENPLYKIPGVVIEGGIPLKPEIGDWGLRSRSNLRPDLMVAHPEAGSFLAKQMPSKGTNGEVLWYLLRNQIPLTIIEMKYRSNQKKVSKIPRISDMKQIRSYFEALKFFSDHMGFNWPQGMKAVLIIESPTDFGIIEVLVEDDLTTGDYYRQIDSRDLSTIQTSKPTQAKNWSHLDTRYQ